MAALRCSAGASGWRGAALLARLEGGLRRADTAGASSSACISQCDPCASLRSSTYPSFAAVVKQRGLVRLSAMPKRKRRGECELRVNAAVAARDVAAAVAAFEASLPSSSARVITAADAMESTIPPPPALYVDSGNESGDDTNTNGREDGNDEVFETGAYVSLLALCAGGGGGGTKGSSAMSAAEVAAEGHRAWRSSTLEDEIRYDVRAGLAVIERMRNVGLGVSVDGGIEALITSRIRLAVLGGDLVGAVRLLRRLRGLELPTLRVEMGNSATGDDQGISRDAPHSTSRMKPRSVSPIIHALCLQNQWQDAALVMRQMIMLQDDDLKPALDEYAALLRALVHAGTDNGNAHSNGKHIDCSTREDVVNEVIRWLVAHFTELPNWEMAEDIASSMQKLGMCSTLDERLVEREGTHGNNIGVRISSASSSRSAFSKRRVNARGAVMMGADASSEREKDSPVLHEQLRLQKLSIPASEIKSFTTSVHKIATERAVRGKDDFERFAQWVHRTGPYEWILDGANIAMFGHSNSKFFSFEQLDAAYRKASALQTEHAPTSSNEGAVRTKRHVPLIILHENRLRGGEAKRHARLIQSWRDAGSLYATPAGSNDDWYWIYAAVMAGENAKLLSNDELRDHSFQMLGGKFVSAWKERHRVTFDFAAGNTSLKFTMPRSYTRCIQQLSDGSWMIPIAQTEDWLHVAAPPH